MNQKDKRKLENELMVMGLAGLNDPDLIQQLADLVSAWPGDKHEYMRDLLNECEPEKRYEMLQAIGPKLRGFKALSLSQYEAQIALKAGAMVSQGRMRVEGSRPDPIVIGGERFVAVPQQHATDAIATVRCHLCPKTDQFLEKTPVAAMIAARKAGWTRDKALNKETCPECTAAAAAEEVVVLSNSQQLFVRDRRRAN